MRVRSKSRCSPRRSKRSITEAESSSTATSEPLPKRRARRNEGEQKEPSSSKIRCSSISNSVKVDQYCWLCHSEADDKICKTCHRAFHESCLSKKSASFSEEGACPECQSKSVGFTDLNSKFLALDKLKSMLEVVTRRSFEKERNRNELFLHWPEEDSDKLFKVIDGGILLDNIHHSPPYTNTREFYGDVKYMHHNSYVAYGAKSDQVKAAKNLLKCFEKELLCLEACPECYYYECCNVSDSENPFIRLCDPAHDVIYAQFSRFPYWPAKCLKVVKGEAHVRFFGEHEQSKTPIGKCFFMSQSHPNNENTDIYDPENPGPKTKRFMSARRELMEYIARRELLEYIDRFRGKVPFHPHRTPYQPQEKQNEVAEGSSTRSVAEMKLEGSVIEDSEANDINAATLMEFSEENSAFPNSETSPNVHLKVYFLDILSWL